MSSENTFEISTCDDDQHQKRDSTFENKDNRKEYITTCGIGQWRPKWIQFMARPEVFLVNLVVVGVIQTMSYPIYFSAISTLERRYRFDSKITGMILLADCIMEIMVGPIAGYFALYFNRARLLAWTELLLVFGFVLSASPYFIYGAVDLSTVNTFNASHSSMDSGTHLLCLTSNKDHCTESQHSSSSSKTIWPAVWILFIGRLLVGGGQNFYHVIGFPYIDDNVSKRRSPIYFSLIAAIKLCGGGLGFIVSGFFLQFFENPFVNPGIKPTNPQFVGAWWLGMLFTGGLILLFSIPLFCFPPQFQTANIDANQMKNKLKFSGGVLSASYRFVTNPVVMLHLIGSIFRTVGIEGAFMFTSKYIESQYRVSSSEASLLMGTTSMLPMAVGMVLGGVWIWWLRPSPRTILIFTFLVEAVSILTYGSGFFLGCKPIKLNGRTAVDGTFQLNSPCNANCKCSTNEFAPVCGGTLSYFSPCHAGCHSYRNQTYFDCACANNVTEGFCSNNNNHEDCASNMLVYLIVLLTGHAISHLGSTANSLISFRSVDPMDKTFTLAATTALMSVFALLPTPILYGAVVDSTCQIWKQDRCGQTGNCWQYDQVAFRNRYHTLTVFCITIGSVMDFVMIFFYDRIQNFYQDDDQTDSNSVNSNVKQFELK